MFWSYMLFSSIKEPAQAHSFFDYLIFFSMSGQYSPSLLAQQRVIPKLIPPDILELKNGATKQLKVFKITCIIFTELDQDVNCAHTSAFQAEGRNNDKQQWALKIMTCSRQHAAHRKSPSDIPTCCLCESQGNPVHKTGKGHGITCATITQDEAMKSPGHMVFVTLATCDKG